MYIVEVRCNGDDLAAPLDQMWTWLGNERTQPSVFRLSIIPEGTILRLEFKAMSEAEAFAEAFGGQMIGGERADLVAA